MYGDRRHQISAIHWVIDRTRDSRKSAGNSGTRCDNSIGFSIRTSWPTMQICDDKEINHPGIRRYVFGKVYFNPSKWSEWKLAHSNICSVFL